MPVVMDVAKLPTGHGATLMDQGLGDRRPVEPNYGVKWEHSHDALLRTWWRHLHLHLHIQEPRDKHASALTVTCNKGKTDPAMLPNGTSNNLLVKSPPIRDSLRDRTMLHQNITWKCGQGPCAFKLGIHPQLPSRLMMSVVQTTRRLVSSRLTLQGDPCC